MRRSPEGGAVILQFPLRHRRSVRLERWLVAALAIAFAAFLAGASRPSAAHDGADLPSLSLLPD